jgi:hypothetical protein
MAGSNILHFGGIRIRVTGNGLLRPTLYGFDKIDSQVLVPIALPSGVRPSNISFTRLSNFTNEAGILRIETTSIDEVFRVNDITLFVKEMWQSYPSGHGEQ